ncbi:MAG: SPOR domain-containing protein, partial [Xanthobacteraceae bacterium]
VQPIAVRTVAVKPGQQTAAVAGAAQLAQAKAGPELSYAEVTPVPVPRPDLTGVLQVKVASASAQSVPASNSEAAAPPAPQRDGWMIQIGAFEQEYEAKQRLYSALKRAKDLLGGADPFTEAVTKGEKTLYRARFAGLKKEQAEAACKYLKKNEIACMALKD